MSDKRTPAVQTIEVDGRTLGYRELGSGHPVLLLHGWPTSSFLWRRVMPPIARTHRVLALDLPGFGASDKPVDGRYDFADFERAIDAFLDHLGIDQVAVAGHDLGGPIATHWALTRPGRARGIALLNTLLYPEFSPAVVEFVTMLRRPDSREKATSPEGLSEIMRQGVADQANLPDGVLAEVVAPFESQDARLALARAGIGLAPAGFVEIAAQLPSLDVPVRVVYGERDRVLPDVAETFARLQRDLPAAQITGLPDCGHFLQEEDPDTVGTLLAEFFSR
ncbi:alpha/beta fold hydrolase [Actinocrispum wychmicini]|uniref:Pimeloyl-ACP methyl ester carboxylesterase n=1 Tax=Actinocrispum wychmicini TaxID=1213861 RepID=A0A4R2JD77_9PSEU|nr:alpha/beta fold hydrolase [Actinocrispum wychmicini]TCO54119.1 pimeloyl-ACP methyl ester carboxylesterase [Actinocrispum wychmicini]